MDSVRNGKRLFASGIVNSILRLRDDLRNGVVYFNVAICIGQRCALQSPVAYILCQKVDLKPPFSTIEISIFRLPIELPAKIQFSPPFARILLSFDIGQKSMPGIFC